MTKRKLRSNIKADGKINQSKQRLVEAVGLSHKQTAAKYL
jgi:hypothetical protein